VLKTPRIGSRASRMNNKAARRPDCEGINVRYC